MGDGNINSKENKFSKHMKAFYKPLFKVFTFFFSVLVSGFLCSAMVTEITVNGELTYNKIPHVISFKILIVYIIIIIIYQYFVYKYEVSYPEKVKIQLKIEFEQEFYKEIVKKECLGAAANKAKEFLEKAKTHKEFIEALKIMKGEW